MKILVKMGKNVIKLIFSVSPFPITAPSPSVWESGGAVRPPVGAGRRCPEARVLALSFVDPLGGAGLRRSFLGYRRCRRV